MRISLLADIHLADTPMASNGVDTRANLSRCIARLREHRPDLVVLMGDYSARAPQRSDVEWICSRVQLAEVDFAAIAGNHDIARDVAEVCLDGAHLVGEKLYYRRDFGAVRTLYLDTSSGQLGQAQTDWLRHNVHGARGELLVFMHHPPVALGVPYMDNNHAFRDRSSEVYDILFGGSTPVHVFCGHYHTARSTQIGPHSVHVCPSTYFQLDPYQKEFAVRHAVPGMRHIDLIDGQVRTNVEMLPPEGAV